MPCGVTNEETKMRKAYLAAIAAGALALTGCASTGGGYGGGGGGIGGTQLSQCMRNALIGAGVGAVLGAATAPDGNRTENAAIGAALGGLGTYAVCGWIGNSNQQSSVEGSYYRALNTGAPQTQSLTGPGGQPATLRVAAPQAAPGRGTNCRVINATVSDSSGTQNLPQETFCRDANGGWVPVA
jgi:YMGG-like Gly-zipper